MIRKIRGFLRYFYAVPWCVPAWGRREFSSTLRYVLRPNSGTTAQDEFARVVREYLGVRFAVPVNRGRTAIEVGLRALGVRPGDEVILPSFICRSVLDSVLRAGATPVFADIDESLNVTLASVRAALTPRTKCVIVAHLFGTPAPIDEIAAHLAPLGVSLIDDAAQALGASVSGQRVGSFGECGIVSVGPGKPLAGAAGGLLVTNDRRLYERARAVSLSVESRRTVRRRVVDFWIWRRWRGISLPFEVLVERVRGAAIEDAHVNATLSSVDAEIGLAQFAAMTEHAAERRRHAAILTDLLSDLDATLVGNPAHDQMPIKLVYLLPESGPSREEIIDLLADCGIEAQGGYAPLHDLRFGSGDCPRTSALWQRVICVPLETPPKAARRFVRRASAVPARDQLVVPSLARTSASTV